MADILTERVSFYDVISRNKRNSIFLIFFVFVFAVAILYIFAMIFSYWFTGDFYVSTGFLLIFILPLSLLIIVLDAVPSYYRGDKLILKVTKSYKPDQNKHRHLLNSVEGLSIAAGIPKPNVYIIPHKDINAFATGRSPNHASIAVTEGALEKLNRKELEGVIAHEISHIRNYDIRYAMLVAVFVGFIAIVSHIFLRAMWYSSGSRSSSRDEKGGGLLLILLVAGIVLAVVAPIISRLAQLAASRRREYLADSSSVELTRYPYGLASALEKIKENKKNMDVSDAVSHLFLDDPKRTFVDSLFETHPPVDNRIKILRSM